MESLSFSANGLYNDDCTTAPTPRSKSVITPKNCDIEFTRPFTSEPNAPRISRGTIKPLIIVVSCNSNDVMVFNANFFPLELPNISRSFLRQNYPITKYLVPLRRSEFFQTCTRIKCQFAEIYMSVDLIKIHSNKWYVL